MTATNADPAELEHFAALAAHWWDRDGPLRTLHHLNPVRLEFIERYVHLAGTPLVDVGCGGGILTEALATRGARVTGIDLNEALVTVARTHAEETRVNPAPAYRVADAATLTTESLEFDGVICMELLEHVPDPAMLVRELAQLCRPNGMVFLSTLNRTPAAFAKAIIGAEYVLGLLPRGTHRYRRFIRPAELAGWARAAGLTTVATSGMAYNPFSGQAALSAGVDTNYLLALRRPA